MIDMYEIRRRWDEVKYRLTLVPKRTVILAAVGIVLLPVFIFVLLSLRSGPSADVEETAAFRLRVKEAVESDSAKADISRLTSMNDKDLAAEIATRQAALNEIQKAGKLKTPEGDAAWGALLRGTQVSTDRQRRAGKPEDR